MLTVADIARTVDFYQCVLGMQHQHCNEFEPKARQPAPGAIDLCLITDWSIAAVLEHLTQQGVAVEQGPVARTGAIGPIESVYFRDPDGNLIEVSRYL